METKKERSARLYKSRKENGLCPRCGKTLDRKGHYCSECLEKVREYNRANRKFYRENHICTECGKNSVPDGERICPECRAKAANRKNSLTEEQKIRYKENFRIRQNVLYQERSRNGICTRCGKRKAMPGRKRCGICLKKDADAKRVKNADKINIREYREKNHLCYFCGKPIDLPTGKTCKDCVEKFKRLAKGRSNENDYWKRQNRLIFGGKAVE